MNATVKFLASENKAGSAPLSGVLVPTSSVRDADGKKIVYIAFQEKALRREVHVLSQRSGGLLVDGLVGGESVIVSGPADLKEGDKIKVKGQS
jgi:multidrug efflux pump subunit AcrA (membrane-fusion protein)